MRVRVPTAALVLAVLGCAPGEPPAVTVRGKVTFQGQPVTEGAVQFNDAKTGRGAEAGLGPDGSYTADLPAGRYAVLIIPPVVDDAKDGPPNPRFKKVRNIPQKYHSAATSGLAADVAADQATHDFALTP